MSKVKLNMRRACKTPSISSMCSLKVCANKVMSLAKEPLGTKRLMFSDETSHCRLVLLQLYLIGVAICMPDIRKHTISY